MQRNAYRSSKKSRTCERGRYFPCPRSPHRIRLGPGVPDLPEPFAIGREFARRFGKHVVERQALNFSGDERVGRAAHVFGYIGPHMVHANVRVGGASAGFAAHGFGAKSREAEEIRPHALDGDERALFLFGSELCFRLVSLMGFHFWSAFIVLAARVRPSFGELPRPKARGRRARWRDSR